MKEAIPIVSVPSLISILVSEVLFSKALSPIDFKLVGKETLVMPEQPLKAAIPISSTPSGIVKFTSDVLFSKALLPIDVKLVGKEILKFVHSLNAAGPIVVITGDSENSTV